MTSLINKIEQLIKREKTTPERKKKDDCKSSSEILSELFSAFNADPPKIDDIAVKKSKKAKKKHKKEKKKRSRSSDSSSDSDSDSHKRKKRKKSKSKKRSKDDRSPSSRRSKSPIRFNPDLVIIKRETPRIKSEEPKVKEEKFKTEPKDEKPKRIPIKYEDASPNNLVDTSLIPMPESPRDIKIDANDLRLKIESKKSENAESDKSKGKIQIKNLKFSAVFEETVKKAEEEARKKAEKKEDGEYTDSSSSSVKDEPCNSNFPKSSDPGGILKKQAAEEIKFTEEEKVHSKKTKHSESSHRSSKRDSSKSRKRSTSRSGRSHSTSKRHHRSTSKSRRRSRSRHRSPERSRRRSTSRTRRSRHSPRPRGRRSRSPTGVRLADSEKKRLLEVARRNAINMLKNGAVPAGAAALPPHTRTQVMAAIHSGGKSVDELTDFCKHLSKKEALGELSSVSSHDEDMSENEDTLAFHHPFLVKEKAPIVMNIRGGAPLPIKSSLPAANKDELRLQFPVSSGSQHREKASEWVPVSPKKDMQVAKISSSSSSKADKPDRSETTSTPAASTSRPAPLALPPPPDPPAYLNSFTSGTKLASVVTPAPPALPAPGPQAYPPGVTPPTIDMASIVSQKIAMIRREQEQNELTTCRGFGWSIDKLGQFTGSTGAHILTPRELASGTQAWAKKDQLQRAAPVEGGMGMHLLQKMGWTPGQGLGKEGTGTLQPLLLEVKLDTKGLQAKEEASRQRGVKVAGVEYQPAVASANKKQAKADAAQLSLQKLGIVT